MPLTLESYAKTLTHLRQMPKRRNECGENSNIPNIVRRYFIRKTPKPHKVQNLAQSVAMLNDWTIFTSFYPKGTHLSLDVVFEMLIYNPNWNLTEWDCEIILDAWLLDAIAELRKARLR